MYDSLSCITVELNQDEEPKDESDEPGHVTACQASVTDSEEEGFPFKQNPDSLALQSVYRYARQIKYFLGWDEIKEDSEPEEDREYSDPEENNREFLKLEKESGLLYDGNQGVEIPLYQGKEIPLYQGKEIPLNREEEISLTEGEDIPLNKGEGISLNQGKEIPLKLEEENYKEAFAESNINPERNNEDNFEKEYYPGNYNPKEIGPSPQIQKFGEGSDLNTYEDLESNTQTKLFRSEVCLHIDNSGISKPLSLPTDKRLLEENYSVSDMSEVMDENLVQDTETKNAGLSLNNEKNILEDENLGISSSERKEKYPDDTVNKENIVGNTEDNNSSNENSNNIEDKPTNETDDELPNVKKNESELENNISREIFQNDVEQNKNPEDTLEKQEETMENDLLSQNKTLNVLKESKPININESLTKYSALENKHNNTIKAKIDNSLKAHIQYENETKKKAPSKEIKCNEKQALERQDSLLFDEDTVCGLGCFKPWWLQSCATAKVYVILYSIIGILHGSYYSYLIGTLSTLEKRFAFKSKISGAIMIADEITPLLLGMIIGYYAGKAHRPRMVALGMLLSAGCCFCSSLPYFIYGPVQHLNFQNLQNDVGPEYCDPDIGTESCDSADRPPTLTAVMLLMLGSFLKGFGNLAYYAIGLAYLDDNSDKKSTPIYLAIALALRLLGPLVGFLMSSGFLKLYENPVEDPGYGPDDPRWVGAWWIGFFLQGVLLVIFTLPIALFPRRLPGHKKMENSTSPATDDSLKDIFLGLLSALKRLMKNPIFLILILNTTAKIFGHFGHAIMLPKYMENQFRLSASEASLFSGATTIFCIMVSTVIGGFLIWKYRPRIKLLLCGMIVSEAVLCIGFLVLMIPRCQIADMSHFGTNDEGLILNSVCNQNCDCSTTSFTPFCGPDGKKTFFSPCYAGCTQDFTPTTSSKKNKEFGNCSCVADPVQNRMGASISEGFCPDESCWNQALAYLIILFCCVTVSSLFTVAHTMILLRSVHPNDKSVALGTFETFICLFGFIPFPVTFGALVDSACLVWEKSCGEVGNCWFYDMDKFGYLLHGAAALFCFISVLCLITLYFLSSRVRDLYADEEEEKEYMDIKLDTVSGSVTKL